MHKNGARMSPDEILGLLNPRYASKRNDPNAKPTLWDGPGLMAIFDRVYERASSIAPEPLCDKCHGEPGADAGGCYRCGGSGLAKDHQPDWDGPG